MLALLLQSDSNPIPQKLTLPGVFTWQKVLQSDRIEIDLDETGFRTAKFRNNLMLEPCLSDQI